ncbi:hypothetical protein PR048_015342 [Dryococelus australis]|uniref:Uncharacterized protein n=1 Tax=Dryococelus australis TaxID=614101 RepID=A0ABQ9HGN7_9NEOP|nr:hypothetical protein PR048_015342 [Dryococelus australis]
MYTKNLSDELYVNAHEECGYFGIAKTVTFIQEFCWVRNIYHRVANYGTMQHVLATEPFEVVTSGLVWPNAS